MRHNDKAKKPSPEKPAQKSGFKFEELRHEEISQARLRIKVGPPEQSWSHAKWLALADQALLE